MKNKIINSIVALALVFGACSKDYTEDMVEVNEPYSEEIQEEDNAIRRNNSEGDFIVSTDGLASAIINGRTVLITRFILTDDFGNTLYAYCADMGLPCYPGSTYRSAPSDGYFKDDADIKIKAAITYIMNHYGWMEASNPHGFRLIIQCVIWRIVHGYEVYSVNNAENVIIMSAINHIYDNIDDILEAYRADITIKGEDVATKDGLFVNYGPYMISENALLPDVYFYLSGATFINDMGIEITQVKPAKPFYVQVPYDFSGDIKFTATASTTSELWYVEDYILLMDIREGAFQPLFSPVLSLDAWTNFYSYTRNFTVTPKKPELEPEPEPKPERITLTGLSWNNGNGNGNGGGINQFTVNGITLRNNRNFVTPANFDVLITRTPGRNDVTAIYTVTERTVTGSNKNYIKVYDIKVALFNDGAWKGYKGTITVDNPGGNNRNQQVILERFF